MDHVSRDYSGDEGLLGELPRPEELPEGVIFVVGSRSLAPLNHHAKQQIQERGSVVDLQNHRLSPRAVLDICRRTSITRELSQDIHEQISRISGGHPLALNYLLNRLRDADGELAENVIASSPSYAGDVAAEYQAVWQEIEDDSDLTEILAVCSRLRIEFTTEWLSSWSQHHTVQKFRRKVLYLFRRQQNGWRFFHDSFRQFAADQTALGDDPRSDIQVDSRIHRRIAELCKETSDQRFSWEQLYHRFHGGESDKVLELAQQTIFREQFRSFRSPDLIRNDIQLAMRVGASRADVVTMIKLYFAIVETDERVAMLENISMPEILFDVGLINEAISWCGEETRRVPLDQAYDLTYRLGKVGHPAGRRIFDLIEHEGLDDHDQTRLLGGENTGALAWTQAAVLFRPLSTVIATIRKLFVFRPHSDQQNRILQDRLRDQYFRMLETLIHEVREDEAALTDIKEELFSQYIQIKQFTFHSLSNEEKDRAERSRDHLLAMLNDLHAQVHAALLGCSSTAESAKLYTDSLLSVVNGGPLFPSTSLDAAYLFVTQGFYDRASRLLDHTPYNQSLTVSDFNQNFEAGPVEHRFQYWKLRYFLASTDNDVPSPIPPNPSTPAGNRVSPDAPIHKDLEAIELSARIDSAIRVLAKLDSRSLAGYPVPQNDAWDNLIPLLDIYPSSEIRISGSFLSIQQSRFDLLDILVAVASNHSSNLLQRLTALLQERFKNQPEKWTTFLRLKLADSLRSAGANAPWYQETLATFEESIKSESVDSRLRETSDIVRRYVNEGDTDTARDLVLSLVPISFNVGYRKDYQFDTWVDLLGLVLVEQGGDAFVNEAEWLACVIAAVNPITEGAPGDAATSLPALVASVDPLAAVRIFEYFVRQGTVSHIDALATLVQALVQNVVNFAGVELATDITSELISRTGRHSYPELAEAVLSAAIRTTNSTNERRLADSIVDRINIYALPTTRLGWRRGLGYNSDIEEVNVPDTQTSKDDYSALVLNDGRRIAREDAPTYIQNMDDIITLRSTESSKSLFSWAPVIERLTFSKEEIHNLVDVFSDGNDRNLDVLASLAEMAERNGDHQTALEITTAILDRASGISWSPQFGGTRLRAAAVAIRIKGMDARIQFCTDLVHQLFTVPRLPNYLLWDFLKLVESLDSDLPASSMWPSVRSYLEGMTETLELPDSNVLSDLRCYWWFFPETRDRRAESDVSTPTAALAELAVGHISHPAWLIRDPATTVVMQALRSANLHVAEALARFSLSDASDEILERAGRCLAAARQFEGFTTPDCLKPLEDILANHPSQVIRDLAADQSPRKYRPLPLRYKFAFNPSLVTPVKSVTSRTEFYLRQYQQLAEELDIDLDTLMTVADQYKSQAATTIPENEAVHESLRSSGAQFRFLYSDVCISRAAFGRILAEVKDARLLESGASQINRLLRTVDIELLDLIPKARPTVAPSPPEAGIDKSTEQWKETIEDRLGEYINTSTCHDQILIGASCRLMILNWGHLGEEFTCGTTVGISPLTEDRVFLYRNSLLLRDLAEAVSIRLPDAGEPIVVDNDGSAFVQPLASWISFRPDLAAALRWSPGPSGLGRWHTSSGELAVETVWWTDGAWGHASRSFDDTVAEGYTVIATVKGYQDICNAFGTIVHNFRLDRYAREDGDEVKLISVNRSLTLQPQSI